MPACLCLCISDAAICCSRRALAGGTWGRRRCGQAEWCCTKTPMDSCSSSISTTPSSTSWSAPLQPVTSFAISNPPVQFLHFHPRFQRNKWSFPLVASTLSPTVLQIPGNNASAYQSVLGRKRAGGKGFDNHTLSEFGGLRHRQDAAQTAFEMRTASMSLDGRVFVHVFASGLAKDGATVITKGHLESDLGALFLEAGSGAGFSALTLTLKQ